MEPELKAVLEGRAFLYDFLGRVLLGPPSAALLAEARDVSGRLGQACRGLGEAAAAGHARYSEALALLPADEPAALLELNRQYTATFSVGGRAVSLYESVYRSVEGLLKQEPWEEVRAFYASSGVGLAESSRELEDHAAVELAFMGQLVRRALAGASEGKPEGEEVFTQHMASQRAFLEDHLGVWLPEAMGRVVEAGPERRALFYAGIADIARAFVQADREFLAQF